MELNDIRMNRVANKCAKWLLQRKTLRELCVHIRMYIKAGVRPRWRCIFGASHSAIGPGQHVVVWWLRP